MITLIEYKTQYFKSIIDRLSQDRQSIKVRYERQKNKLTGQANIQLPGEMVKEFETQLGPQIENIHDIMQIGNTNNYIEVI